MELLEEQDTGRDHLVTDGKETNLHYKLGSIQLLGANAFSSVICIAEVEGQLLICVPNSVWHKKSKDKKLLPGPAFKKAIAISVSGVSVLDRESVVESCELKVWVGLLSVESERYLDFADGVDYIEKQFETVNGEEGFLPYAEALVAAASEHFIFLSAEEEVIQEHGGERVVGLEDRVMRVEGALSDIQESLSALLAGQGRRDKGRASTLHQPSEGGGKKRGATEKKAAKPSVSFEGLEKSVVEAALQAGIEEEHLAEMANIVRGHPKRMEDLPRPTGVPKKDELSESEDSSEEEDEAASGALGSADGAVAKAIVKLTKVCSALADGKKKRTDGIESLLDQSQLGASSDGSGLGSGRKNAQALRALKRCLQENPEYIYKTIESNLMTDFTSRVHRPGDPMGQASVRGWLESRSRILNYTNHVRWSWAVGGIWDDLIHERYGSARARAALLTAASDQAAIDSGSWLLSNVSLLENQPPYQSFAAHQVPGPQDLQHSALWDPRWFELFLSHVKELDSYQEARKKLSKPVVKKPEDPPKTPKTPKGKPKAKGGGRDKDSPEGETA